MNARSPQRSATSTAAIRGLDTPRHLAVDEAMGNAEAIADVLRAALR